MMRYRKRPGFRIPSLTPIEADKGTLRSGPLFAGMAAAVVLGAALVAGLHHLLRYEFLRTAYVFAIATIAPLFPMAAVMTYVPRRRPRAAFTTQVEIPGTNAPLLARTLAMFLCYATAAGTMVYGFITSYPVHAFLWATGPASTGYILMEEYRGIRPMFHARQNFALSPTAIAITSLISQETTRIPWTDNAHVGTTTFDKTQILPDPTTNKPPYTTFFEGSFVSRLQLDRLLDHFNTHPADRQLLAQPEGADLVQTLLDTTPRP